MTRNYGFVMGWLLAATISGMFAAHAADKGAKNAAPSTLTPAGEKLLAKYTTQLAELRAQIAKSLPAIDESLQVNLQKARDAVKKAEAEVNTAQQPLNKIQSAKGLVEHAKGKWIGGAEKGIAAAEAALKKATTPAEREAAQKDLAKWQANKEDGIKALKERQAALDLANADAAKATQTLQAAQATLAREQANEQAAGNALLAAVQPFLASDKLDVQLVRCAALSAATPRGLAEFGQQGAEQAVLVEKLLADTVLLKQMLAADGAKNGKYGQAMQIYTAIQQASSKARTGHFQRLALAVSLEHAEPIAQSNPLDQQATAPATVDPVKRYLHYEKAFLAGELDPAFKDHGVWEYRSVVNGDEPDEMLAWGREMLRNYRPDHVLNPDYGWRYSGAVRTDVAYGSQNVKDDRPALQNYQNIILNGGVCGRRAFFGRFILRSFGVPTAARPQKGHAALVHWTPQGWVVNLGAGFGCPDAKGILGLSDTDFLLETQVRKYPSEHDKSLRAVWVANALEEKTGSQHKGNGGFWQVVAQFEKKALVAQAKAVPLAALGAELGEANESAETKAQAVVKATATAADKQVVVAANGTITVPAAACSGNLQSMKSFQGGIQAFCGGEFTCNVDAPKPGQYQLTARVVTVHDGVGVQITTNSGKAPVELAIPYTCGKWELTKPTTVTLNQGKNVLSFSKPAKGFTLKELTLTPVK